MASIKPIFFFKNRLLLTDNIIFYAGLLSESLALIFAKYSLKGASSSLDILIDLEFFLFTSYFIKSVKKKFSF